jgi:hypothetical protein
MRFAMLLLIGVCLFPSTSARSAFLQPLVIESHDNGIVEVAGPRCGRYSHYVRGHKTQGARWSLDQRPLRAQSTPVSMSDLDIYRTANILVKEYGAEQAPLMAAKRADALLDLGDIDGQCVWKAVLRAVNELIRPDRKPGEQVN